MNRSLLKITLTKKPYQFDLQFSKIISNIAKSYLNFATFDMILHAHISNRRTHGMRNMP